MALEGNKLYWNRVGHVEVEDNDGDFISYTGLDFKFSVEVMGCTYNRFSVGICGLSRDTLNQLITWQNPNSYTKPKHIRVYGGYADGGENLIIEGGILTATPTIAPNVWLNITGCKFMEKRTPIDFEGYYKDLNAQARSFNEIYEAICTMMGLFVGDTGEVTTVKDKDAKVGFQFVGSVESLVQRFADAFGIVAWVEDGGLKVADRDGQMHTPKNVLTVDRDHGLLSVDSVQYNKASVTMRLNTAMSPFRWINLTSQRMEQANGNYWVTSVRHVGQLRGEAWNTSITMLRQGIQ